MKGIVVHQRAVALNDYVVRRVRLRLSFANGWRHPIMTPRNLKLLRIGLALYPGCPDGSGESNEPRRRRAKIRRYIFRHQLRN
jgi:hypothetical protein